MDENPGAIEIVATPAGEAPPWVREAWIGLTLPLARGRASGEWRVFGVLTAPTSWLGLAWACLSGRARRVEGYRVPSAEAIRRLAVSSPEAAEWWRTHTVLARSESTDFIFDAPACRLAD
jgi:hypothetical protein